MVTSEPRAQQAARAMQLGFRTADRHAEFGGDLLVLPAFDVVQHEDRTRPRGQGRHRAFQVHRQRRDVARRIDAADGFERVLVVAGLGRLRRARSSISAVLTASRCNQVLKALSKR
jgi:hypothetical protein